MGVLTVPVGAQASGVAGAGVDPFTRSAALNHYCTSYTYSHGKKGPWPRRGHPDGTGYSSNLRPAVFYTPNLDKEDNPKLGLELLNACSQMKWDYQPLQRPGSQGLPTVYPAGMERESGYHQYRFLPPIVPMSLQTEYKGCFIPHRPRPPVVRDNYVEGAKEGSGFTTAEELQPYTFIPHYYPMDHDRRMGRSIMKSDLTPKTYLKGSEEMPALVKRAVRETGFTRDTVQPLAAPASLLPPPVRRQKQKHSHLAARNSQTMPPPGSSGFIQNARNLGADPQPPLDPNHYVSHYQNRFCNVTEADRLRLGWTRDSTHRHIPGGYGGRDTDRDNLRG
ncbi:stabilizer of axonemal microtubules 4 [Engraulis encrasicolus]|uniref:stabilizer of axonemal microtubules 4 n=1 Tax=Engraulis encrasicolus TaxID=184585 RepID=UPI002FD0AB00